MPSRLSIRNAALSVLGRAGLAAALLFLAKNPVSAIGITSLQSGNWYSSSTWDSATVPTSVDSVTVAGGHTVTIASMTCVSSSTLVLGTLKASRLDASSWTLVSGDLTVGAGGTLDYGSEADPIPNTAFAHLILSSGTTAGQYGLIVNSGGNFTVRGSTKTPYSYAVQGIATSDTSLTVYGSTSTDGWQAGDVITIGPTSGNGTATTSSRTITSITGGPSFTVNWSGGVLPAARVIADGPIVVANLTRNVLVRSSGTIVDGAGGNTAYIRTLAQNATSFALAHGEFAYLGANLISKSGITIDSLSRGSISSSTVRGGYRGIYLNNSSNNTLTGNNVCFSSNYGILLDGSSNNTLTGNNSYSNLDQGGIYLLGSSANNTVTGNNSYSNSTFGITLNGSPNNTLTGNNSYANSNYGMYLLGGSSGNALTGSVIYSNASYGINLLGSSSNNTLTGNSIYSNANYGLFLDGSSSSNTVVGGGLGYNGAGVSKSNTSSEIYFEPAGGAETLVLKGTRVNPTVGISSAGMDLAGVYLLSYNQEYSTGSVRIWGNYRLAGSTLTLDHAVQLYASTNTTPKLMRGTGHSITAVVTKDAGTSSELITVTHTGGNSWAVTGSTSGSLGSVACAPSTSGCAFSHARVDFNLNTGASNGLNDALDFVTSAASGDANVQKKLLFGPAASGFNNGRSKLEAASSAGVVLRGKSDGTAPTLIDMFAAGSTYYTFVDSGAFTAVYSSFSNADQRGIQLSGTAGVTISSSSFDFLGFASGTNTFITARDLTSNATFYDAAFGLTRSSSGFPSAYNVRVEGTDSGLSLTWRRSLPSLGELWGENFDDDANNKVVWDLDWVISSAPYVSVSSYGLTAVWTSTYPVGTAFTAQVSTGAFPNGFAGNLSSVTFNSSATFTGLNPNTTYFARVSSSATGVFTSLTSTSTLATEPTGLFFSTTTSDLTVLIWSGAGNGPGARYTVLASTAADPSAPAGAVVTTSATFNTFLSSAGLTADTSYFFRVAATNNNGVITAYTAIASTRTPIITAAGFTSVSSYSLTVQWNSSYSTGTSYVAQVSTGAFPNAFAGNLSSTTLNLSATFFGLSPNTTYFTRVSTSAGGSFVSLNSTSTLATEPTGLFFNAPTSDRIVLNWSSAGNGPGTIYTVLASTAADPGAPAGAVVTTSLTFNASVSSAGLAADTSYFFRVAATNNYGYITAFTAVASTRTPIITAAGFTGVSSASLMVNWNSSYSTGTSYYARISTGNFPNSFAGNLSSATLNLSATFYGLSGNTTYFTQVSTVATGLYISLGSTSTLAALPTGLAFSAQSSDLIVLNWSSAGNGSGTIYTVLTSTAADPSAPAGAVVTTSVTFNVFLSSAGLVANTTYYFQVAATNNNGMMTTFTAVVSTPTSLITAAGFAGVSSSALTAQWNSSYADGTSYFAQISTGIFPNSFAGNLSSTTLNKSATFPGLSGNTTYYARISTSATGVFINLSSTSTLAALPANLTFSTPTADTIVLNWSGAGNGPGTIYTVLTSTASSPAAPGGAVVTTSFTFNTSLSSAGLLANVSYFFQVSATNNNNLITTYTASVTTMTLPAAPAAAALSAVFVSSASANWTAGSNANAASLVYRAQISTGAFQNSFAGNASTLTAAGALSVIFGTGGVTPSLSTNTVYYFQVQAVNASGSGAFTSLGSTRTLPDLSSQPGTPSGAVLGISSISWSWSAAPSAAAYRIYAASNTAAPLASTPTLGFLHTGLSTNTAYGLVVAGYNANGEGTLSAGATVYTLAAAPSGLSVSANAKTSATIVWSNSANPAGTLAEVQRSTDGSNFGTFQNAAVASYSDTSLSECTTYHFRVRYANGDGLPTAFASAVTFRTQGSSPTAPSELTAVSLAGQKVQLSWTASPTSSVVEYRLYSDMGDGSVDYGSPLAVVSSATASFVTGVLASSASYRFALRAKSACGVEDPNTSVLATAASVVSLGTICAVVKTPNPGKRVKGNRLTVLAETACGDGTQVKQVLFQYKASSGPAWLDISAANLNHPNPDTGFPYFVHWDVSGLPSGNYDLRAVATDISDRSDPAPGSVTVAVVPSNSTEFDLSESETIVSGKVVIKKEQTLQNQTTNTIQVSDAATGQTAKCVLPAQALSADAAVVTVIQNPALPTFYVPAGSSPIGSSMEVTLSNGQSLLSNGKKATLTISYPDVDSNGIVDNTKLEAKKLQMFSYNGASWSTDIETTVNISCRTVSGLTPHFSFFVIFGIPTVADPSQVRIWPNPYKPNSGNPDVGVPYRSSDPDSGIVFDRLADGAMLRIYDAAGELVAEYLTPVTSGRLQWDVKNSREQDVASGVYYAVISAPGYKSVVKRVMVIR